MPGVITHLLIGKKILDVLQDKIDDVYGFYLGNIAPDAIMSKDNYQRIDKTKSHLKIDISSNEWYKKEYRDLYEKRIESFIKDNITSTSKYNSFYLGYLIHLLTDQLFNYTLRADIMNKLKEKNIITNNKELLKIMTNELDATDYYHLLNNPEISEIINQIKLICNNYSATNLISNTDLCNNFKWIDSKFFNNNQVIPSFDYITEEDALNFVDYSCKTIISRISSIV